MQYFSLIQENPGVIKGFLAGFTDFIEFFNDFHSR